ncbi:MAG: hypothetical protein FJW38_01575 [Acidobacteria bacterium]|nr:hypothetical protein [Acidobacteriota bacterium]
MLPLFHRMTALACACVPLSAQTPVGPGIFDSTRGSINNTQVEYSSPAGEIPISVPGFNGRMRIQFPRSLPSGTVSQDGKSVRLAEPVTVTLGVSGTRVAGATSSSTEIRASIQYGNLPGCAPLARNFPVGSTVDLTLTCTLNTVNLPVSVTPAFFPALLDS